MNDTDTAAHDRAPLMPQRTAWHQCFVSPRAWREYLRDHLEHENAAFIACRYQGRVRVLSELGPAPSQELAVAMVGHQNAERIALAMARSGEQVEASPSFRRVLEYANRQITISPS